MFAAMVSNRSPSADSLNGMRTVELGSALVWLRDQLRPKLGPGSRTISTVDATTVEEQKIVGIAHILTMVFPLAVELALKSLWESLHGPGGYLHTHDPNVLFQSLDANVTDFAGAQLIKTEARNTGSNFKTERSATFAGSLDDFLAAHANDFAETRYYKFRQDSLHINELLACFLCLVCPSAKRDQATLSILFARIRVTAAGPLVC